MAGKPAVLDHHKEMGAFNQINFPAGMAEAQKRVDMAKPLSAPMAPKQREDTDMQYMMKETMKLKKK